ncbi:MAG TPA: hypothetical protein VGP15_05660, partial [Burkholderiales bacterium]|nr:hypothetical protein [Burkholderiales bacterium]
FGLTAVMISDAQDTSAATGLGYWTSHTDQIIVTRNAALLASQPVRAAAEVLEPHPGFRVWTDDFYNLMHVLKH